MLHPPVSNDDLRRVSKQLDDMRLRMAVGAGGRFFSGACVQGLMDELADLRDHAKALENEVSAMRWNQAAQREREDGQMVEAIVASQRGDRVVLFPNKARRAAKIAPIKPSDLADNDGGDCA